MRGACATLLAAHSVAQPSCAAAARRRAAVAAPPHLPASRRCCRLRPRASPEGRSEAGTPFFVRARPRRGRLRALRANP
jgi:hypothetical protein